MFLSLLGLISLSVFEIIFHINMCGCIFLERVQDILVDTILCVDVDAGVACCHGYDIIISSYLYLIFLKK